MNKKSLLLLPLVLAILLIPAANIYAGNDDGKKDDTNQKKVEDKSKDQSDDSKNKVADKPKDDSGEQDKKDDSTDDNSKGNNSDDENKSNEQNTNDSNSDNNSESNEDAANNDDTNQNTSTNDEQNVSKKDDDERKQRTEDKTSKESNDDSIDENSHMEHDMGKSNDSQDTSERHWYHDFSKRDKIYLDMVEKLMDKSSNTLVKKYENELDDVNPNNLINRNLNIKNDAPVSFLHKQTFETFLAHKVTIDFDNERVKVGTSHDDLVYDLGLLADGYYHSATMFDNRMTLMKKHCVGMTLLLIDAIEEYEHLQFSAKRHHEAYENIMFIIEDITDHWIDK